uniref:Aminopeptidase N n=1 Tax=Eutreptiella gymnastica TaxID=73025 RepID=A0A6T2JG83_9EUGL
MADVPTPTPHGFHTRFARRRTFGVVREDLLGAGVLLSAIAAAAALWSYGKRPVTALQGVVATSPSQPVVAMFATTSAVEAPPKEIFRKDYKVLPYEASHVDMKFELRDEVKTTLTTAVAYKRRSAKDMVLSGESKPALMELVSVKVGDTVLTPDQYTVTDKDLTIPAALLLDEFVLEIVTKLDAGANTSLSGLYKSSGIFCTQEEAEGFRNMTYFYDRPDNMATYTTLITAEKQKYPYLLSNGNPVDSGDLEDGLHFVKWEDPWPKPCYLFALVAGDLACVSDEFVTVSGRKVLLRIFVEHGNEDQTTHAMESLKKSFKWDEERFGREYDLDQFNVVAVSDFNMGAMENKSLNVFNDRYVLANPKTATDSDFSGIERVVGHEYFHNWTGNRVTCRDWFQLTLKEGLTVYRDQEFSADMNSRAVKRIGDVMRLRTAQFRQDAGPMAHPIRPESYISMDNFYTVTVYEKGAEVIRMMATILGTDGFRKGTNLYFERHDGQAVTCDDFVAAMEDATGEDFTQFKRWYSQAGTPVLEATTAYDADLKQLSLTVKQSCPATPKQSAKEPFDIPLAVGLIGKESTQPVPLKLQGDSAAAGTTKVLRVTEPEQTYTFVDVPEDVVPSLLREFSAPVKLTVPQRTDADLQFLMAHDTDEFCRWEAGQEYAQKVLLALIKGETPDLTGLVAAFKGTLCDTSLDNAFKALALSLPTESYLADLLPEGEADPDVIHEKRELLVRSICEACAVDMWAVYEANKDAVRGETSGEAAGRRSIKNLMLMYLTKITDADPKALTTAIAQFESAENMTDQLGAMSAVVLSCPPEAPGAAVAREEVLANFYEQWKHDNLVVLKWLGMQASGSGMTVEGMQKLMAHEAFELKNPNKVYATIGGFCAVPVNVHKLDGSGYKFMADVVKDLDKINPQVAARMAGLFTGWKKYAPAQRRDTMKAQMESMLAADLSPDTYEILSKSLL